METKKEMNETDIPVNDGSEILDQAEQQKALDALAVTIKENMKRIYMEGMTTGGQGYIGVLYDMIKKEKSEFLTADEILLDVEMMCRSLLDLPEEEEEAEETEEMTFVLGEVKGVPGIH